MIMEEFEAITARMGPLLKKLQNSPRYGEKTLRGLPQEGVYVFYEGCKPMYVGRSSRQGIRKRVQQHTIPSSSHNQAVFAFKLLQETLAVPTGHGAPLKKPELAEKYESESKEQKRRVRNMEVRAVKITDSLDPGSIRDLRCLGLEDPYNSFDES